MLRLRPYRTKDACEIVRWCEDEALFYKWTAGRMGDFPLTVERLNEVTSGRLDNDQYFPFVLTDNDQPVGFFTMRTATGSLDNIRFGYIIVNPSIRGKGYGKSMLRLGMKYAFELLNAKDVSLGVFSNNDPAHYCYRAAGLRDTDIVETYILFNGEAWDCIEMTITREEYLKTL